MSAKCEGGAPLRDWRPSRPYGARIWANIGSQGPPGSMRTQNPRARRARIKRAPVEPFVSTNPATLAPRVSGPFFRPVPELLWRAPSELAPRAHPM